MLRETLKSWSGSTFIAHCWCFCCRKCVLSFTLARRFNSQCFSCQCESGVKRVLLWQQIVLIILLLLEMAMSYSDYLIPPLNMFIQSLWQQIVTTRILYSYLLPIYLTQEMHTEWISFIQSLSHSALTLVIFLATHTPTTHASPKYLQFQ